jgi:hypothetical protein
MMPFGRLRPWPWPWSRSRVRATRHKGRPRNRRRARCRYRRGRRSDTPRRHVHRLGVGLPFGLVHMMMPVVLLSVLLLGPLSLLRLFGGRSGCGGRCCRWRRCRNRHRRCRGPGSGGGKRHVLAGRWEPRGCRCQKHPDRGGRRLCSRLSRTPREPDHHRNCCRDSQKDRQNRSPIIRRVFANPLS